MAVLCRCDYDLLYTLFIILTRQANIEQFVWLVDVESALDICQGKFLFVSQCLDKVAYPRDYGFYPPNCKGQVDLALCKAPKVCYGKFMFVFHCSDS